MLFGRDNLFESGIGAIIECKIGGTLYYVAESATQWLFVVFCVQRIIAITRPFLARQFLTKKTTVLSVIGVLTFCAFVCIPAALAWEFIIDEQGYRDCVLYRASRLLTFFLVFLTTAQKFPISTTLIISFTIYLGIKLIQIRNMRTHHFGPAIQAHGNAASRARVAFLKEKSAGIIMILMVAVQGTIYAAESVIWESLYVNRIFPFLGNAAIDFLLKAGHLADFSTILVRLWNFYPYFIRIPAFRASVLKLLGITYCFQKCI